MFSKSVFKFLNLFVLVFSCGCGLKSDQKNDVYLEFVVVDKHKESRVEGAQIFFTDYNEMSMFDWKADTDFWGLTDSTGMVRAPFAMGYGDSIQIRHEGFYDTAALIRDESTIVVIYIDPETRERIDRVPKDIGKKIVIELMEIRSR